MTKTEQMKSDILRSFGQELDKQIYDDDVPIDDFLVKVCKYLTEEKIVHSSRLLFIKGEECGSVIEMAVSSLDTFVWPDTINAILFSQNDEQEFPRAVLNDIHYSQCRIAIDKSLAFLIQIAEIKPNPAWSDQFLYHLSHKARDAIRYKEERHFEHVMVDIAKTYMKGGLQPTRAWAVVASFAIRFLPDFKPLKRDNPAPRCQILTHAANDRYMVLRASSEDITIETAIGKGKQLLKIDEIVCGIPIQRNLPKLVINPTIEHSDRYGAFLFPGEKVKSEVIITLYDDKKPIGVLNFEHPNEDAFYEYTIHMMVRAAESITPFVSALLRREQRQRSKDIGQMYVIGNMIEGMNSDLNHKVGNSVLKARLFAEKLINASDAREKDVVVLNKILQEIAVIQDRSVSFLKDVPNYLRSGHQHIERIFNAAIDDALIECKLTRDEIAIEFICEYDGYIFASLLIREHLKNLIVNSMLSILERKALESNHQGKIRIYVYSTEVKDLMEKEGSSPTKVNISISDNGRGVSVSNLSKIKEFGFTTRKNSGGTGYGLSAAIEYIQTIFGGDFSCENVANDGFVIRFYVLAFNEQLKNL